MIWGNNFKSVIFEHLLRIDLMNTSCEIALEWMPGNMFDDKSTLVEVMAWCRQATSHYLSQCWPMKSLRSQAQRQESVVGGRSGSSVNLLILPKQTLCNSVPAICQLGQNNFRWVGHRAAVKVWPVFVVFPKVIKPSLFQTGICQDKWGKYHSYWCLSPCVARTSAAMVLTSQDKHDERVHCLS